MKKQFPRQASTLSVTSSALTLTSLMFTGSLSYYVVVPLPHHEKIIIWYSGLTSYKKHSYFLTKMFHKLQHIWKALIENFKLLATIFITCQIDLDCSRENIEIFSIMFGFGTISTNEKQIHDIWYYNLNYRKRFRIWHKPDY